MTRPLANTEIFYWISIKYFSVKTIEYPIKYFLPKTNEYFFIINTQKNYWILNNFSILKFTLDPLFLLTNIFAIEQNHCFSVLLPFELYFRSWKGKIRARMKINQGNLNFRSVTKLKKWVIDDNITSAQWYWRP